jgi:cytoskeletal protein RodZ
MSIFGETLRQARAHKGVTVKEAEQATRISRLYLNALEDEHFEALPALIYQRGIVRNYATYLDLDPNKLLALFEEARGGVVEPEVAPSAPPLNMPPHWAPNFAIIAFILVLGMIVFAWFYSAFLAPGDPEPSATAPVQTVTPLPTDQASQSQVRSLLPPSPTPTATPTMEPSPTTEPATIVQPTETPRATVEPSPTASGGALATRRGSSGAASGEGSLGGAGDDEPTEVAPPTEETERPTGPVVTVLFTPSVDIVLTVIGDGVVLWDSPVAAGESTPEFTASLFEVYTSDVNDTWVTNVDTGDTFIMNEADGPADFTLAPV